MISRFRNCDLEIFNAEDAEECKIKNVKCKMEDARDGFLSSFCIFNFAFCILSHPLRLIYALIVRVRRLFMVNYSPSVLYSEPKIEHRLMSSFVQYHNQRFNRSLTFNSLTLATPEPYPARVK